MSSYVNTGYFFQNLEQTLSNDVNKFVDKMHDIEEYLASKLHHQKHIGEETHHVKKGLMYVEMKLMEEVNDMAHYLERLGLDYCDVIDMAERLAEFAVEDLL